MPSRVKAQILSLPRTVKSGLALAFDVAMCLLTVLVAYYLRLGYWLIPHKELIAPVIISPLIAIPLFVRFGLYRAIFRYSGAAALASVLVASTLYAIAFATIFTFIGVGAVPRTMGLIQPLLLGFAVAMSRVLARFALGDAFRFLGSTNGKRNVLIYGAGAAGRQLASALAHDPQVHAVGFIDDDRTLQGNLLNGLLIHGPHQLEEIVSARAVSEVLLAVPSASRKRKAEIIERIAKLNLHCRTLPSLADIASGKLAVSDLRELDIDELLGRNVVPPSTRLLREKNAGHTVLVTGSGGSIGSELCRQIVELEPISLILVEINEFALYTIDQELKDTIARLPAGTRTPNIVPVLASVTDAAQIDALIATWQPDTIYHAAAYKHVPLVEENALVGVRNNTLGTLTIAEAARRHKVANFVLISTDKAVRPTNIMGASKRLAEMVLQAFAGTGSTCFSIVRFGNVLGSSGSVVPLFRQQIVAGGPITLTHEEVTRYFMTIPEAAQLVLQAGAMARGGEVFVLDMGESVRIIDLARRMVELSGLRVKDNENLDGDIAIEIVGLRPGEKLYEELLIGENPQPTDHAKIMMASESHLPWDQLAPELDKLQQAIDADDRETLVGLLTQLVTGYTRDPQAASNASPKAA